MPDSIPIIKIRELPEATESELTDASAAVVDDGTTTRKTKLSTFVSWLKSKLNIGTMQEDINNLNTNTPVGYTGYDPSGKFEAIDDKNSWIRTSRIGKFVHFDAGLKIKTNFGVNTKYRICALSGCTAHQTQHGYAISQLTGKVMLVTVSANENLLYINSQSQTVAIGDQLWVHIHYTCK